jgi:hypothetical protein
VSDLWEFNPGIDEAFSTRLASAARMVRRRGLNRVTYRRQRCEGDYSGRHAGAGNHVGGCGADKIGPTIGRL